MAASYIGAATQPINNGNLTTWINDGAAKFNAMLQKSGITPPLHY